jgi:hypothetical protein
MSAAAVRRRVKKAAPDAPGALPKFRQSGRALRNCYAGLRREAKPPQHADNHNAVNCRIALHKNDFSPLAVSEFPLALA